jgi:HK97 family phage portal protein
MKFLDRIMGRTAEPTTAERAVTLQNTGAWGAVFAPVTAAGTLSSPTTALGIPAVYAAVSGVADSLATLPLPVFRTDKRDPSHPVDKLLNAKPNVLQTPKIWRSTIVTDMFIHGEHFSQIVRNGANKPVALWRISPASVRTEWDTDAQTLKYYVGGSVFPAADLVHVIYFTLDGFRGISPLALCRESIGLTQAIDEYGASFFANDCTPGGLLRIPDGPPENIAKAKAAFQASHSGSRNSRKTLIATTGTEYQPIGLTSEEGQFHESRTMQLWETERICRVAPHVVQDYSRQTWGNLQYARMEQVQNSYRPMAISIDQELTKKLFSELEIEQGYRVEHVLEGLLKGSFTEQMDYLTKGVDTGIYTPNEARGYLNLQPLPGGDELQKSQTQNTNTGDATNAQPIN